jgi:transposase IS66 family protein
MDRKSASVTELRAVGRELDGLFGLKISEGAIANMLARAAKPFAECAEATHETVRNSPVIASDEISARVKGKTYWQWVSSRSSICSNSRALRSERLLAYPCTPPPKSTLREILGTFRALAAATISCGHTRGPLAANRRNASELNWSKTNGARYEGA